MQTNLHLHENDTHDAVVAEIEPTYVALKVAEAEGGQVVVFVSNLEQAQQLGRASLELIAHFTDVEIARKRREIEDASDVALHDFLVRVGQIVES